MGKSKGNSAAATFWFWGYTNDDSETQVLYRAGLKGTFSDSGNWPPATATVQTLTLTDWRIAVENEGREIKAISCLKEGVFDNHVKIEVVNTP